MNPLEITLSWPDHPANAEMIEAMRGEVRYHIVGPQFRQNTGSATEKARKLAVVRRIAAAVRRSVPGTIAYQKLRSVQVLRAAPHGQLIHACSHLIYGDRPWIGDYENVNVLGFYSPRLLRNSDYLEHLRRAFRNDACRAIRVWSHNARHSFETLFTDPEVTTKLRVIYPAMALPAESLAPSEKRGIPTLLFVGKGFWVKGGSYFLEAVKRLRASYEFRVDFVCDLPAECEHYRTELAGTVEFHEPRYSRQELFERFYRRADVFVMLGMADSYGLALLEAAAFSLPIVAMKLDSGLSDLLRLTTNAIQIEPEHQIFDADGVHVMEADELVRRIRVDQGGLVAERVAEAIATLLSDSELRSALGMNGRTAIMEGSLSVSELRKSVREMYSQVTT